MPISETQKPRNRWRREKYQREMRGKLPVAVSKRSRQRRFLRQLTREAQVLEGHLAAVLRFEGKTWRHYEKATKRESERIVALARARRNSDALANVRTAA